ncbi:MAG: inositol monophosphatase family protein [Planctomycetota bacterium]
MSGPESLAAASVAALGLAERSLGELTADIASAAVEAAIRAGELQLESLGAIRAGDVRTKSSMRDLVTEVDVNSERLIVSALRAAAPGFTVEAEEEASDEDSGAPRWIVDPLDGTVNFVHDLPVFAVSIALYADSGRRPLLGIVHVPRLGETFIAAEGRGAYLVSAASSADAAPTSRRLSISRPDGLADAILATGFPYRWGELPNSNLENFNAFFYEVRGVRRMGAAAVDLAYVAAGRLDGYWELHLGAHDVAAGALLVREAGGEVTDLHGGDNWLRLGHVVAADASLAAKLRERLVV